MAIYRVEWFGVITAFDYPRSHSQGGVCPPPHLALRAGFRNLVVMGGYLCDWKPAGGCIV